jgi:hypothetical protein
VFHGGQEAVKIPQVSSAGRLALVVATVISVTVPAWSATLQAGVARVDITRPAGVSMWGYSDRKGPATDRLDPLYARILVRRLEFFVRIGTRILRGLVYFVTVGCAIAVCRARVSNRGNQMDRGWLKDLVRRRGSSGFVRSIRSA